VYPRLLYDILPFPIDYQPYTSEHVTNTLLLFFFTGLCFWWLRDRLKGKDAIVLDTDWFYRKLARLAYRVFVAGTSQAFNLIESGVSRLVKLSKRFVSNPAAILIKPVPGDAHVSEFDADKYRLSTGIMILLLLFIFVAMLATGIIQLLF
jgi:multicomponent Na+:H+ antiporter subunit D